MHETNRLTCQRNHRLGVPRSRGRLLGASSMYNDSPLTTIQIRQGPFARPALPGVVTTMSPSDSPQSQKMVIDSHRLLADRNASSVRPLPGVSQVHDCSFDARCPQPPRAAQRLHPPVASSPVPGFTLSGRLATTNLRNEAESGSLALRLTSSSRRGFTEPVTRTRCPPDYTVNRLLPWLAPFI
jgi:hypothetical protein